LLPQAFLANTLQNLIENSQYGTWVDESLPDTEREQSRYRTTICVLNLLTKPSIRFKFLKESALKASLDEFIFAKDVREYAEPRDLVFLLEIINNLFGRNTAKRLVNEYEIYDWWQPNNNLASSHYSEIKRLDEFYSRWLEEGEKRRLSLQYEAYSLGNGYRMALLEEQKQVKEVRTLLDRNLAQLNIRFFPKLDLPKARALGLPPHLLKRLRHALNKCSHINDLRHLRSLFFIDIRLRPWHDQLPEANNSLERTEKLIAFLYNKQHSETKANGLISLLEVLSERLDESDACYVELIQLIKELEDTI
jgi:hypothetical protein